MATVNTNAAPPAPRVSDAVDHCAVNCPIDDYDPWEPTTLLDPYGDYARLRDKGGVVFLSRYGIYVLPRYATVRTALDDWGTFSSAKGVMLNDVMNEFMAGTILCSDPPQHDAMRKVIMRPLEPRALRDLKPQITAEADELVDRLCDQGEFNAATELAEHLPFSIVTKNVGLPPVGRESMLRWAPAAFNCIGPLEKPLTQEGLPVLQEVGGFIHTNGARDQIAPGSWLARLYEAADEGLITHEQAPAMSFDYIGPAVDTTISATAAAIYLFASNPDQWQALRERPALKWSARSRFSLRHRRSGAGTAALRAQVCHGA